MFHDAALLRIASTSIFEATVRGVFGRPVELASFNERQGNLSINELHTKHGAALAALGLKPDEHPKLQDTFAGVSSAKNDEPSKL